MPEQVQESLSYDKAAAVLLENVFAPVYFQKLASYGFMPSSREEAARFLQLADKVRVKDEMDGAKRASATGGLVECANRMLDEALGAQPGADDPAVKHAAAAYAQDPVLRDAALLYQDAINQAMGQ